MKEMTPKLFRGSKEDAFAMIQNGEIEICINLETETRELIFGGANEEIILCMENSVRLYDFSLSGYLPPNIDAVQAVFSIIFGMHGNGRILFHCRKGEERTGFIAALVRIVLQGWTFEEAVREWLKEGCNPVWAAAWSDRLHYLGEVLLKEYQKNLPPKPGTIDDSGHVWPE